MTLPRRALLALAFGTVAATGAIASDFLPWAPLPPCPLPSLPAFAVFALALSALCFVALSLEARFPSDE